VGALGFGVWAFMERQDYKNNVEQKIAAAQAVTKQETEEADALKYAEEAKNPLKAHVGPSAFGSVTVAYPKTWSAYISEDTTQGKATPVDDYFHPDVVPAAKDGSAYALRVQVLQQPYAEAVKSHTGAIKDGRASAQPYALPKVPDVIGTRIEGELAAKKTGTMIILPLRNVTLQIYTESDTFKPDFNNIILANLTFSP
jgi:hypothetical protein